MGFFSLAFFGALFGLTLKVLHDLDVNKVVYNHQPGKCSAISGIDKGSEDIILLNSAPYALISSGAHLRFAGLTNSVTSGNVFLFNLNDASNTAEKLEIVASSGWNRNEFQPLGLGVFEGAGAEKPLVYAINGKKYGELDVFELNLQAKSLKHLRTIKDPLFKGLNNIAVVGKDKFYVSNYYSLDNDWLVLTEVLLQLPIGSVVYFDGQKGHVVASSLKGPNGLAISKDKTTLFVALNPSEEILAYRIKTPTELEKVESKSLYTGVDNLNVDQDGNLWTAAHPVTYKALAHLRNPSTHEAPSQVLKISINQKNELGQITEVFADEGHLISGSTVAAVKGRKLLIGSIFHRALLCELS